MKRQFLGLALSLLGGTMANAAVINLPSTGTDASGVALSGGSVDSHYTVTLQGSGSVTPAVVYSSQNLWSAWVPDSTTSAWIGHSDNADTRPYGNYVYELQFDLSGYAASSASLKGVWAADQDGYITLNGNATGVSVADGNWGTGSLSPFGISSGFVAGINTLDFVVNEPDGFDGLRVDQLQVTATPAVPEPATACLGLIGLAGVALARRRQG